MGSGPSTPPCVSIHVGFRAPRSPSGRPDSGRSRRLSGGIDRRDVEQVAQSHGIADGFECLGCMGIWVSSCFSSLAILFHVLVASM